MSRSRSGATQVPSGPRLIGNRNVDWTKRCVRSGRTSSTLHPSATSVESGARQMIRRHATAMRAALMAADLAGAVALFMVASWIRYGGDWEAVLRRLGADPWLAAAAYGTCWVVLLALHGMYRLRARLSLRSEAMGLLRA